MGRPKTIQDDELLAVARQVFRQHGHTATTRDVAKAAGISQAVLYQRFKTKDDLFYAALTQHAADIAALLDIDASLEPRAYLAVFAARVKDHFISVMPSILSMAAHPRYGKEMMGKVHQLNRVGDILPILRLRLQSWQKDGRIRPTDEQAMLFTFIRVLNSMAMVEVISGQAGGPTKLEEVQPMVNLLWDGLAPTVAPKPAGKK
jgi:AcrR family transcriptional regulator